MSFSKNVKTELCKIENQSMQQIKAQAYGMSLFSRVFSKDDFLLATESLSVARCFSELITILTETAVDVTVPLGRNNVKDKLYTVSCPDGLSREALLNIFGHSKNETALRINRANIDDEVCFSAFLRGAFLACGSVTDPQKDYHLEFVSSHMNISNDLAYLISEIDELSNATPKTINRKGNFIVYIKGSEGIADILTLMGAQMSSLEFIQEKILKSVRNNVNRKINSETANSNKTAAASAKQLLAIERIKKKRGLKSLPSELYDLAVLRLENPESSLRELGEMLNPPISRSGVNHRMKRLMEMAEELTEK